MQRLLDQSGEQVANMDFREASTSTSSEIVEDHSGEIQPEEPDTQQPDISSAACASDEETMAAVFHDAETQTEESATFPPVDAETPGPADIKHPTKISFNLTTRSAFIRDCHHLRF